MTDRAGDLFLFAGVIWASCRIRKPATCCVCQKGLQAGDLALRPMTEDKRVRRYERLCVRHGHRAVEPNSDPDAQ